MLTNLHELHNAKVMSLNELVAINNQHGEQRCRARGVVSSAGYWTFKNCKRWNCWLHGEEKIEIVRQACELMIFSGRCTYSITWRADGDGDASDFDYQKSYIESFQKWRRKVADVLRKRGERFSYIAVHAIGKNGNLHTHIITSHDFQTGDGVIYCQPIQNPSAMAEYLAKNLRQAISHNWRGGWRHTTSSGDAPKWRDGVKLPKSESWNVEIDWRWNHHHTITISKRIILDAIAIGWRVKRCNRCHQILTSTSATRCKACKQHDKIRHHGEAILNHTLESSRCAGDA